MEQSSADSLKDILENKKNYYQSYKIPKKSGGYRTIVAPSEELKKIQKAFWRAIETYVEKKLPEYVVGFRKNKSILHNANPHLNQEVVVNLDISDFFPSIPNHWLIDIVSEILKLPRGKNFKKEQKLQGITPEQMVELLTVNGKLCQGSPCSPGLANLYLTSKGFDYRMNDLPGWKYTRYADDLTFSSHIPFSKNLIRKMLINPIYRELEKRGLKVNSKKTTIRYKDQQQLVTGILVNGKKAKIAAKTYKKVRAGLYRDGITKKTEGYLNFINSINKEQSHRLLKNY